MNRPSDIIIRKGIFREFMTKHVVKKSFCDNNFPIKFIIELYYGYLTKYYKDTIPLTLNMIMIELKKMKYIIKRYNGQTIIEDVCVKIF